MLIKERLWLWRRWEAYRESIYFDLSCRRLAYTWFKDYNPNKFYGLFFYQNFWIIKHVFATSLNCALMQSPSVWISGSDSLYFPTVLMIICYWTEDLLSHCYFRVKYLDKTQDIYSAQHPLYEIFLVESCSLGTGIQL